MNKKFTIAIIVACALSFSVSYGQTITTIAGNGTPGYNNDNIAATAAELYFPTGIAEDENGNLYIADHLNNRVRKVSPAGIITTIAGNGSSGYTGDNAAATAATLNGPTGVAADAAGNIYIADNGNNCIRKVNAAGIITTVAGNGTNGYTGDNGPATAAQLDYPSSVAVDGAGNLFIVLAVDHCIRKVSAGTITTFAGTGTGGYNGDNIAATAAELYEPSGAAIDNTGNVYIADNYNHRIRKVDPSGTISTVAGNGTSGYSGDNGAALTANLSYPAGIQVDASGNMYIADGGNYRVRKVNASGVISTIAGNGTNGYNADNIAATAAELSNVSAVALDAGNNIIISDHSNHRIRKVAAPNGVITPNGNNDEACIAAVYPNPSFDMVNIQYTISGNNNASLTLVNVVGKKVLTQNLGFNMNGTICLSLSGISAGDYTLQLWDGSKMVAKKLVKQ